MSKFIALIVLLNTENQQVYTWGWRECIPTGRVFGQVDGDSCERNISFSTEQGQIFFDSFL